MAKFYGSWEAFSQQISAPDGENELSLIHGVGALMAKEIVHFWYVHAVKLIDPLLDVVTVLPFAQESTAHALEGKRIVLTGTLKMLTRREAKERLEALGAQVLSAVSAQTDYVVVGENAGSKNRQAMEKKIPRLDEDALSKLID